MTVAFSRKAVAGQLIDRRHPCTDAATHVATSLGATAPQWIDIVRMFRNTVARLGNVAHELRACRWLEAKTYDPWKRVTPSVPDLIGTYFPCRPVQLLEGDRQIKS